MKEKTEYEAKLREMVIYISQMCFKDDGFGKTKLNKILFNIDFHAYRKLGKSITEQPYIAMQFGPVPKIMRSVLSSMEQKKEIAIQRRDVNGKQQERPFPLRPADITKFTREELAIIFESINEYWSRSGTRMSNESHDFIGWRAALRGEIIPYAVSLVDTRDLALEEIQYGERLDRMAKDCLARNASANNQDSR